MDFRSNAIFLVSQSILFGPHLIGQHCVYNGLAAEIIKASKTALDGVWQLPIDDEYDQQLKSNFADMANIGSREATRTHHYCTCIHTHPYTQTYLHIYMYIQA